MHNSLPHIFETIIPGIFLTFILTLATCTQVLESKDNLELQLNEQMHEDYRAQRFDDAIDKCRLLHGHFDHRMEGYYNMWIERCEYMKTQTLPPNWNGTFVATSK